MLRHWSVQPQDILHEQAERVRLVHGAALLRRKAAVGAEVAIGGLGLADARGRRAEDQGDSIGAVAVAQRPGRVEEPVLVQAKPGQAIVARVMMRERRRKPCFLQPGDAPDEARQRVVGEVVLDQAAAALAHCLGKRIKPACGSAGNCVGGDGERWYAGGQTDNA
jgi:hypothetical protein